MTFDGFKKTGLDPLVDDALKMHFERFKVSALDAVKLWPVFVRPQWLKRFLAHEELFRQTLEIPGDIAELGVFHGADLFTWAKLLESFCVGDRTKTVWGFDSFEGFKNLSAEDGQEIEHAGKKVGGFSMSQNEYEALLDAQNVFDQDRFIPWKARIKIVKGDIEHTVFDTLSRNPGLRFSLIHFDCDLYEPTMIGLKLLWPLLSVGGIAIFDEYGIPDWPGETRAVDEYFGRILQQTVELRKFSWTNAPAAYVVKKSFI